MAFPPRILLATRNEHKIRELRRICADWPVTWLTLDDPEAAGAPLVEETGATYLENALLKAEAIAAALGVPAVADDSGIEVDALGGRPGPRSARFAGEDATDSENLQALLHALKGVPTGGRTARYRCVAAAAFPGGSVMHAEAVCEGAVMGRPTGDRGFGYDPVFQPAGWDLTMAELTDEQKDRDLPPRAGVPFASGVVRRRQTSPGTPLKVGPSAADVVPVGARARRRSQTRNAPLEGFFGGISPPLGFALGCVFVALVGVFDHVTGPAISLAPLMLMPVLLVTWNGGRLLGIVMAGVATVSAQLADIGDGRGLLPSWNAFVWLSMFVLASWLLAELQTAISKQENRMGRLLAAEAETSTDLREQNDLKDTLLHAVSHDLKGPLAGVLGAMQTIRRAEKLGLTDAEMQDLYGVIEQAGAKAARLVDDLLDLDRLDRGQLKIDREPTDVLALARRAARELPTLAGHPVRVDGPEVRADVDGPKVERIIDNLLVNAARHTAPGTPIQVEVRPEDDGLTVVVEDQGPGVPDGMKEAVFEAFRQGEAARGGVGIGLSLVRRFAELHGGSARVEDRRGGGARFVVRIPGALSTPAPNVLRAV